MLRKAFSFVVSRRRKARRILMRLKFIIQTQRDFSECVPVGKEEKKNESVIPILLTNESLLPFSLFKTLHGFNFYDSDEK